MKAKIWHRKSTLDKVHQFFIVAENVWIWYYLGAHFGDRIKFRIYPFAPSMYWFDHKDKVRLLKEYNYNGAREIAEFMIKRIERILKKK